VDEGTLFGFVTIIAWGRVTSFQLSISKLILECAYELNVK